MTFHQILRANTSGDPRRRRWWRKYAAIILESDKRHVRISNARLWWWARNPERSPATSILTPTGSVPAPAAAPTSTPAPAGAICAPAEAIGRALLQSRSGRQPIHQPRYWSAQERQSTDTDAAGSDGPMRTPDTGVSQK